MLGVVQVPSKWMRRHTNIIKLFNLPERELSYSNHSDKLLGLVSC